MRPVSAAPAPAARLLPWFLVMALTLLAAGLLWQWQAEQRRASAARPSRVDVGFAQTMARHHQQAVLLAQLLLDDRPSAFRGFAQGVAGAQLQEIGRLQGWLALWDEPELPNGLGMDWMLAGPNPPDDSLRAWLLDCQRRGVMPGALAQADLQGLHTLAGPARDRLFAELMLRHHEGAIPMAQYAAANATIPAVRNLAARIVLEQTEEIATLRRIQNRMPPVSN